MSVGRCLFGSAGLAANAVSNAPVYGRGLPVIVSPVGMNQQVLEKGKSVWQRTNDRGRNMKRFIEIRLWPNYGPTGKADR